VIDQAERRRHCAGDAVLALALMLLVAAVFWDITAFDLPGVGIIGIEPNETDAIVIAFLLVIRRSSSITPSLVRGASKPSCSPSS
jgi:hypothetical protein